MKNRLITSRIQKKSLTKFGRIMVITGARQTGKTTLVRQAFPDFTYLSIEDPVMRKSYASLSAPQWLANYPKAILDEIQKGPILVESIKSVYDQFEKPRYILLGSSQILLLQKVKESLAGRSQIIELYPLTLPELLSKGWDDEVGLSFLQKYFLGEATLESLLPNFTLVKEFAAKKAGMDYFLDFGGYPALTDSQLRDAERQEWLVNYVKTYLERDIRDLVELRELEPFMKIQQMVALHTGKLINFSKLAKEAGVTSKTAQRYLQYLEISYQAMILLPWYRNSLKKLVRTPKVHFLDPGIVNAILRKTKTVYGNEYESAVVAEIYKQIKSLQLPVQLYHLRTLDGREIDLLLETEAGYIPIEIKMSDHISETDARNFRGLEEILDKPVLHQFILSNDLEVKHLNPKTTSMPAAYFLTSF
ncbi:MAG TPA: hypothetical protein DD653_10230 [Marinilabiliales bacterium]|nr:hypothetical protein [Marinilabiliales bacterium]